MSAQIIDLKMQAAAERQQPGAGFSVDATLNGLPPELRSRLCYEITRTTIKFLKGEGLLKDRGRHATGEPQVR
jgi:hypothetical protein